MIGGIWRDGEHGVNRAGFQQFGGDGGGDTGPLCALCGGRQAGAQHGLGDAEEVFFAQGRVGGAAVGLGFEAVIIGPYELAGVAAIFAPILAGIRRKRCKDRGGACRLGWGQ